MADDIDRGIGLALDLRDAGVPDRVISAGAIALRRLIGDSPSPARIEATIRELILIAQGMGVNRNWRTGLDPVAQARDPARRSAHKTRAGGGRQ